MRILFIDDDELRTRALREGLELFGGHQIVHEKSPNGGVERFQAEINRFDLVILDIMLPHYNIAEYRKFAVAKYFTDNENAMYTGLLVFQKLFNLMRNRQVHVPIVVLTYVKEVDRMLDELNLQPLKLVYKPVKLKVFVKEIQDAMTQARKS